MTLPMGSNSFSPVIQRNATINDSNEILNTSEWFSTAQCIIYNVQCTLYILDMLLYISREIKHTYLFNIKKEMSFGDME